MKQILLATAATLALSLPAMAAPANAPANNSSSQQMNQMNKSDMQNGQQSQTKGQMGNEQQVQRNQQERINPKQLSKQEIKSIQQALNKKGFSSGHVDGVWGRDTDTALKHFQQKQGLPGNGHLNQQTLAALGVNESPQSEQGTVGSGSNGSMNSGSSQMNNSTNGMNKNSPKPAQQQNGGAK